MSSGLVECPNCKKSFDVVPWVEGKIVEKPRPWICNHCEAEIDFIDEDNRWKGLKAINSLKTNEE